METVGINESIDASALETDELEVLIDKASIDGIEDAGKLPVDVTASSEAGAWDREVPGRIQATVINANRMFLFMVILSSFSEKYYITLLQSAQ